MKISNINGLQEDVYIISSKHLRHLDNIFRKQCYPCNLIELQKQILDWAKLLLLDERREWSELRNNSVDVLCRLDRKEEARQRAVVKNKRYEPFKEEFKQFQKTQFRKFQKAGKVLSANAFVKWFLQNKADKMNIPYQESNLTNQLIKLAQINNREFKKLSNAEADTLLTVED